MMNQTNTQLLAWLVEVRLLLQSSEGIYTLAPWLACTLGHGAVAGALPAFPRLLAGDKWVIGLTGNIAMGKSAVLSMAAELGAETIDADALVHDLRAPGAAGYQPLINLVGTQILLEDGRVNATMLGEMAFADKQLLDDLGKLFRPLVVAEIKQRIMHSDAKIIFIEAIRLVDGQLRHSVDEIWVVNAARETQIHRLMTHRGLSEESAVQRIDAQPPQQIKLDAADVIIDTDGIVQHTRQQVLTEWQRLMAWLSGSDLQTDDLVETYLAKLLEINAHGLQAKALTDLLTIIATEQVSWSEQAVLNLIDKV